MPDVTLHATIRRLDSIDRANYLDLGIFSGHTACEILRVDGAPIGLKAIDSLREEIEKRIDAGEWDSDRGMSDRWIAPRFHHALRISRSTAANRGMWEWLASTSWQRYVSWRWKDTHGNVSDDRWHGPVHKQALMRLWWGGELFRDGGDYSRSEKAFILQDFPNSFLHRPLVRSRSFALGLVDALFPTVEAERKASEVNDLARKLNLSTAGTPPEVVVGFVCDRDGAHEAWSSSDVEPPDDWNAFLGPDTERDTTDTSVAAGTKLAIHGMQLAGISTDA